MVASAASQDLCDCRSLTSLSAGQTSGEDRYHLINSAAIQHENPVEMKE
jgi:hypothetical protein